MPLYEYQCKKCEKKFESIVSSIKADEPQECPECGAKESSRLLSSFCASVKSGSSPSCNLKGG